MTVLACLKMPFVINDSFLADGYVPLTRESVGYIVMGVVFDDQDRILLIQEAKARIRGLWYIPAGRVEPGENLVVCRSDLYIDLTFICTLSVRRTFPVHFRHLKSSIRSVDRQQV